MAQNLCFIIASHCHTTLVVSGRQYGISVKSIQDQRNFHSLTPLNGVHCVTSKCLSFSKRPIFPHKLLCVEKS